MTRLGAFDALSRGIANVRANPALILVAFAGMTVVILVVVASVLPWMGLMGIDPGAFVGAPKAPPDPGVLFERLRLLFSPGELAAQIWTGLLSFTVGLTIASIIFSWYWGGILGVLAAADAQAPPGTGRPPVLFRTWSLRLFVGEGNRLALRLLLYWSIVLLAILLLILLLGLVVLLAIGVGAKRGAGAGLAVGCGAAIPLVLLLVVTQIGAFLGKLELVDRRHGVWSALRAGFDLLGRRLGAVLLLEITFVAVSMAISIGLGLSTTILELLTSVHPVAHLVMTVIGIALQWIVAAALSLTINAAGLALVRSERALEPVAE